MRARMASAPWPITTQRRARLEPARGVENVGEQRAAGQRMQDLGQVGEHPLALAGGEDDDLQRHAGEA